MNSRLLTILLTLAALSFTACGGGDDDGDGGGSTKPDTNANTNKNNTTKSSYATNIEMPHLMSGSDYILLTKTSSDIGLNYTIEWDCQKRAQRWTCWSWTKANNYKGWTRNSWAGTKWMGQTWTDDPFQPDPDLAAAYRTELSEYSNTGYNRGHMCASEDRICSMEVNGQTFFLTNMHPQIYNFNGKVWATMENKVRSWRDATTSNGGTLYVCKGGTIGDIYVDGVAQDGVLKYNPETARNNADLGMKLIVPKYFFMVVLKQLASGGYTGMAFWAEHKPDDSTNLTPYMKTIDEVEALTGYDFFCNLPDAVENSVESTLTTSEWK